MLAPPTPPDAVSDLEAELARRRDFASTIAHEVLTPLTSIRAALGLLTANEHLQIGTAEREILSIANRNCVRLAAVLDDFLELENLDHGQVPLRLQRHALPSLVASAIAAEATRAAEAGVEVKMNCPPHEAAVHVDGEYLHRCLVRVLSNAIKFSARGQKVEIDTHTTAASARIAVRDHGPGIPAGWGLAITKQLVEKMGGSIAVNCPAEGGTRVTLEFPLAHSVGS